MANMTNTYYFAKKYTLYTHIELEVVYKTDARCRFLLIVYILWKHLALWSLSMHGVHLVSGWLSLSGLLIVVSSRLRQSALTTSRRNSRHSHLWSAAVLDHYRFIAFWSVRSVYWISFLADHCIVIVMELTTVAALLSVDLRLAIYLLVWYKTGLRPG